MKCSTSSAATRPSPISSPGWTRAPRPRAEALLAGLLLLALAQGAAAAPKAERWERWAAHDESHAATIPHAAWSSFLARYLKPGADSVNRLAYGRVTADDRKALDGYVRGLEQVPIGKLARAEQRAYWINLYNAATVRVVLEHYPVPSIMDIDISPGWFARGPWKKKLLTVEGEPLSLDDIEHRILRPLWRDPRTHYAVNCASIGCPNLAREAYTAANLEAQLEQGARDYVNHPRGAAVRDGALVVSSIYVWFQEDFGGSDAGVLDHLRRYAGPALARQLSGVTAIGDHAYDWTLNEAR